jgi:hypothetical protein
LEIGLEKIVTDVVVGNTAEEFLLNFQGVVQQGFKLDTIHTHFGYGIWQVEVKRNFILREQRLAQNKIDLPISDKPYNRDELALAKWGDVVAIAKSLGVKLRDRQQTIRAILLKQENKNGN